LLCRLVKTAGRVGVEKRGAGPIERGSKEGKGLVPSVWFRTIVCNYGVGKRVLKGEGKDLISASRAEKVSLHELGVL